MSDYISREADGDDFVRRADIVEKFMDRLPSISVGYLCKVADEIPAADVRPVRPCDGCPFSVCEKHGVICPSDPDFRCDTRGGADG